MRTPPGFVIRTRSACEPRIPTRSFSKSFPRSFFGCPKIPIGHHPIIRYAHLRPDLHPPFHR